MFVLTGGGAADDQPGQRVSDPPPVAVRIPPAMPDQPDEHGRIQQQPDHVHRLFEAEARAKRREPGHALHDPGRGYFPLGDHLLPQPLQPGVPERALEDRHHQPGRPLLSGGERPGHPRQELAQAAGFAGLICPRPVQDRHRLIVARDGDVNRRLQQAALGTEQCLDGRHRHPRPGRHRSHCRTRVAAIEEDRRRRSDHPPAGTASLSLPDSRPVTPDRRRGYRSHTPSISYGVTIVNLVNTDLPEPVGHHRTARTPGTGGWLLLRHPT